MLLRPLEGALGSQSKISLLRVLVRGGAPVSAREAARLAGIAHSGALRALDDLVALGLVDRTETPGQHLYVVNRENELVTRGLVPLFEAEQARVREVFAGLGRLLRRYLADGRVVSVVVFGSAARGEDRPDSDLDLLVVTRTDADAEPVHRRLAGAGPELFRRFGVGLSPVVLSTDQLARQAASGDPFVDAVVREGRQVAGLSVEQLLHRGSAGKAQL